MPDDIPDEEGPPSRPLLPRKCLQCGVVFHVRRRGLKGGVYPSTCSPGCRADLLACRKRQARLADAPPAPGLPTSVKRASQIGGAKGGPAEASRKRAGMLPSPAGSDRVYDPEEEEFLRAVEKWKRQHRKTFPTCCELLRIAKGLGYRKCQGQGRESPPVPPGGPQAGG